MGQGGVHVTGRLDRKLTKTEKVKEAIGKGVLIAAKTAGRTVGKATHYYKKNSPGVKKAAISTGVAVAKGTGSVIWEGLKKTNKGKKVAKKLSKLKKLKKQNKKGFHKECRWIKD